MPTAATPLPTLRVLALDSAQAKWAPSIRGHVVVTHADSLAAAGEFDAVVCEVRAGQSLRDLARREGLQQAAFDTAVIVLAPQGEAAAEEALLQMGVQDVLVAAGSNVVARAIGHAVLRKRLERAARNAYATDLATGLPHQAQLLEHMAQLIALRERDPAPMGLIVLRVEGLAAASSRLGAEAASVLRRKVAVRLRAALRAGDVVAATGPDSFGVLLGHLDASAHAVHVSAKLVRALAQPFQVTGQQCTVGSAVGLALYPDHGKDARALLQRAMAQANSVAALAGKGLPSRVDRGSARAANDDITR